MSAKKQVQSSIMNWIKKSPATGSPSSLAASPSTSSLANRSNNSVNVVQPQIKVDSSLAQTPTSSAKKRPRATILDSDEDEPTTTRVTSTTASARKGGDSVKKVNRAKCDPPATKKKRTRIITFASSDEEPAKSESDADDSDGDPDFKLDKKESSEESSEEEEMNTSSDMVDENEDPMEEDEDFSDDEKTPSKKKAAGKKGARQSAQMVTPKSAKVIISKSAKTTDDSNSLNNGITVDTAEWPPSDPAFDFLRPEKIRDINGHRPDHPDYDKRTLYVPKAFMDKQTDAKQQWWKCKAERMDTVLAFKVGKFYELFNDDAIVGIRELNLLPMGGSFYHSGFPEKSFMKYADILREKNYRVARVEQTESNAARDARIKHYGKSAGPSVVRREVCQIITPGTLRFSTEINLSAPKLLMSIYQEKNNGTFRFGVSFVDTSIGKFTISQFTDDKYCSRLRTLLAYNQPIELLIEKQNLTPEAEFVLKTWYKWVHTRVLKPEKEFLSASLTLELIKARGYFTEVSPDKYPEAVDKLCDPEDSTRLTPNDEYTCATRSLGGLLWYLKDCLLDEELASTVNYEFYHPPDESTGTTDDKNVRVLPQNMILDASTLAHLDIIDSERGVKYSLLGFLDHTSTRFGKRMFRSWVCSPLTNIDEINNRLDAVDDLELFYRNNKSILSPLSSLPDMEKLLSQLHKCGLKRTDHPDDRAQMFEDYDKPKVKCLLQALEGLKKITNLIGKLEPFTHKFKSKLLVSILTPASDGGSFPHITGKLKDFEQLIDMQQAKESLILSPKGDWDPELTKVNEKIAAIDEKIAKLKKVYTSSFAGAVKITPSKKDGLLLEVKSFSVNNNNKKGLTLVNSTKNLTRFSSSDLKNLSEEKKEWEDKKETICQDTKRKLFAKFSKSNAIFMQAVTCVATFDCLLSLAKSKAAMYSITDDVSRPQFKSITASDEQAYISVENGKHPILAQLNPNFVPNDVSIQADKMIILTGPNMGGKSTLMRQTALISIMAQIGSYVTAKKVTLTPVDRVFTRIGAYDNIAQGDSTFKVEMDEASAIVKNATYDSLILMDELGRGTSTHDGTAIAHAVVKYLCDKVKCRTFFSTHYHDLVEGLGNTANVQPCHMRCSVRTDPDTNHEQVHFLYKVGSGDCPKSHGFNAASLAGLPKQLIKLAQEKAQDMHVDSEITAKIRKVIQSITSANEKDLRVLLASLKI